MRKADDECLRVYFVAAFLLFSILVPTSGRFSGAYHDPPHILVCQSRRIASLSGISTGAPDPESRL